MSSDLTILDLDKECGIVWDVDVSDLDYVRQTMVMCNSRSRPIGVHRNWVRVGYAVLKPNARPDYKYPGLSYWDRRLFWLKDYDPYEQHCPIEAVDPETVSPGVVAEQTEKCWGIHYQGRLLYFGAHP
mgnify:FL=1